MEQLVVGNPGCEIGEIIRTLKKSPVIGQIDNNLYNIAMSLGTPVSLKTGLRNKQLLFEWTSVDCLEQLLENWRQRCGSDARLILFIQMLQAEELNDFAQSLRERFIDSTQTRQSGTLSGEKSYTGGGATMINPIDLIRRQKDHLIDKMPDLVEMAQLNASFLARMQSRRILSRADLDTLDALPISLEKNRRFFYYIHDRLVGNPDFYDQVIQAFEELNQCGVAHVLKNVYDQ